MAQKELLDYIKNTRSQGFSDADIKKALQESGWEKSEIKQAFKQIKKEEKSAEKLSTGPGFFARYKKLLLVSLAIIILVPLLAYGGFFIYENYFSPQQQTANQEDQENLIQQQKNQQQKEKELEQQQAKKRDEVRLQNITEIQTALSEHFSENQQYPESLETLTQTATSTLQRVPLDPKTENEYLYTPLGTPPVYYSLAFILETDISNMKAGLHVVSSEKQLESKNLLNEEETIRGARSDYAGTLEITQLDQSVFTPTEEVAIEVSAPETVELKSAVLLGADLRLTDNTAPFNFRFTAPKTPGSYTIQIFSFDNSSKVYFGQTTLVVK